MVQIDYTFPAPGNTTSFIQQLQYLNSLTDVGAGGTLGIIFLVIIGGALFFTMKAFGVERSAGTTFLITGLLAVLLRIMGLVNNTTATVCFLLLGLGIYLLMKESANYEN